MALRVALGVAVLAVLMNGIIDSWIGPLGAVVVGTALIIAAGTIAVVVYG